MLDQQSAARSELENDLVREVLRRLKTGYLVVDGKDLTPRTVVERRLSLRPVVRPGGRPVRRSATSLQLMLILARGARRPGARRADQRRRHRHAPATEDLLDSWPARRSSSRTTGICWSGSPISSTRSSTAGCATCPAVVSTNTCGSPRPAARPATTRRRPAPTLSGRSFATRRRSIAALDRATGAHRQDQRAM